MNEKRHSYLTERFAILVPQISRSGDFFWSTDSTDIVTSGRVENHLIRAVLPTHMKLLY